MAFLAGLLFGLGLIVAIGAQNAFVLRQGLLGRHVLAVCLCCAVSDAVLIAFGTAGMSVLFQRQPELVVALRIAGALFLTAYAGLALRRAWRGGQRLTPHTGSAGSLAATIGVCLLFTWLNPHVYLDTLVLLGTVASTYDGHRLAFAAGAISASFGFFFALGYGAVWLRPLFAKPLTWQLMDMAIGLLMAALACRLAWGDI